MFDLLSKIFVFGPGVNMGIAFVLYAALWVGISYGVSTICHRIKKG